jgi:ribosomal protein S6--L-glutamate ligase
MKILILSRNETLQHQRARPCRGNRAGHEVRVVDYLRCYMNITSRKPRIFVDGEELVADAVIPRIAARHTFYGNAVVRQFEMMNVFSLNDSVAIARSRDKLRSLQILAKRGIGLPVTGFAHHTDATGELIKMCGGPPLVIKLLEGTQGVGVVLAETANAAESVIEAFKDLNANILVQEFIKEADGADIRCIVVGGKVVASMKRQGAKGEFRSNLHRGGTPEKVKIPAGALGGHRCRQGNGPERRRRRFAPLQPRPGGDGSELLARAGRHRTIVEKRRRRHHHRVHRAHRPEAVEIDGQVRSVRQALLESDHRR